MLVSYHRRLIAHRGSRLDPVEVADGFVNVRPPAVQNPLPPPPPLPPPLDPPPPDPDELGLDDILLAAALDMLLMLCEKLETLNGPIPPEYQSGGSRYMS